MLGRDFGVPGAAREVLRLDDGLLSLDRKFVKIHVFASY
jgi:hypothetical protein